MEQLQVVITGIGTDVGKTVVAAIVAEALNASYWKPVQAGSLEATDSMELERLCSQVRIVPEAYRLSAPMSPHAAAQRDQIKIDPLNLTIPEVRPLVVEGAGGIMVPINDDAVTYLDLMVQWKLPVVLVSRHYLGSINHSLLSAFALREAGVSVLGFIFVGENPESEAIILKGSGYPKICTIPEVKELTPELVRAEAQRLRPILKCVLDEQ